MRNVGLTQGFCNFLALFAPFAVLEAWAEDFEAFHARFAYLFARREPRKQAAKYLQGLLAPIPRKNGWQVAEAVGDATPDRTQQGRPAGRPCRTIGAGDWTGPLNRL